MTNSRVRGHKSSSEPYQELDEIRGSELNNVSINSIVVPNDQLGLDRSLELTSVSVVPDGNFFLILLLYYYTILILFNN